METAFIPDSLVHPAAGPTPRVLAGMRRNTTATPELFAERAVAATRSFRETEGQPLPIRRALMIQRILEEHPVVVRDGEAIVGSKTWKPRGSPVFPEINCAWVERDLDRLAARKDTPFFVSDETKAVLRQEVFPYWRGRQVVDRLMEAVPPTMWRADDRGVLYHYFRSRTVGHINPGYAKVLTRGIRGIREDLERSRGCLAAAGTLSDGQRHFLDSVGIVLDAVVAFAHRHAVALLELARTEPDAGRRAELEGMAAVCARVPEHPAASFREALQSFWFTHLVMNLETDGHAFGPGRFDQYFYPCYLASVERGEVTAETAQELLDLLWVKFDEITLAKDCGRVANQQLVPRFSEPQHRGADARTGATRPTSCRTCA